jgi:hypothetical protein
MYTQQARIALNISSSAADIPKGKIQRYSEAVDFEAKAAIKHTKRLELKIGPNYLHDILDTI